MEARPLISVIVPVYNAGIYLKECIDTIVGQRYENLEILLVDDGSTDGSSRICDEYGGMDTRIQVIHQENTGAAGARKTGILAAQGDYICFVDADDRIDAGMMDFFVEQIGPCDLITSGYRCETAAGKYVMWVDSLEEGIYDTEEARTYFLENMISYKKRFEVGVQPYSGGKLYRAAIMKDAVRDIDPTIVYSEDRDLLFRHIVRSKSIRVTHQIFYEYRYNHGSIMHTVNKNFMSDLNKLYLSLEKAFAGHPQEESLMHQLQLFLVSRIYLIPSFMGFSADAQILGHTFPFPELERGSRIALYGAGVVGTRYYRHIHRQDQLRLVLWVDKNWRQYEREWMPVTAPEELSKTEFEYIIIAVKEKRMADEIRHGLVEMGIEESRILWREPVRL